MSASRDHAQIVHPRLNRIVGGPVVDREGETVTIRWGGFDVIGRPLAPEEIRGIEKGAGNAIAAEDHHG